MNVYCTNGCAGYKSDAIMAVSYKVQHLLSYLICSHPILAEENSVYMPGYIVSEIQALKYANNFFTSKFSFKNLNYFNLF